LTATANPTFLIAGEMKCGTTAIARYLAAHPDVFVAPRKEVHFFDRRFAKGMDWYLAHFLGAGSRSIIGEATAHYFYDPDAPRNISATFPGMKLIVMLRNPVDRAYSQYWHARTRGYERLSFEDALEAEQARLKSSNPMDRWRHSYVDRGWYMAHLSRNLEHFDRSAICVVISEDLRARPGQMLKRVFEFLGADPSKFNVSDLKPVNEFVRFRSPALRRFTDYLPAQLRPPVNRLNMSREKYPPMAAATRQRLAELFAAENAKLAAWLGRDLSVWDARTEPAGVAAVAKAQTTLSNPA
jgi:hypothetical protein